MSRRFSYLHNVIAILAAFFAPATAFAYVGPGAGITAIGSVLALLLGILLAIVGFLWYPLKRFMRSRFGKANSDKLVESSTADEAENRKES